MGDIYMILYPHGPSASCKDGFNADFTSDAIWASKCIEGGKRVFKLNNLTELKEVKVSFEEVPMELT